jgi:uncharacterized protein Smg (DUF494 family)
LNHRMTDILIQLLRRLAAADPGESFDQDALAEELMDQGHSPEEIRQAMLLINERFAAPTMIFESESHSPMGHRVLMDVERFALSNEVQSLLLELQEDDILKPGELEAFIEKAIWAQESNRPVEELKLHLQRLVLFNILEPEQRQRVVLPKHNSQN